MSKSPKRFEMDFDDPDRTWDIGHDGIVTVDVHKLLRKPKARQKIAKAREIMARIRAEKAAKQ